AGAAGLGAIGATGSGAVGATSTGTLGTTGTGKPEGFGAEHATREPVTRPRSKHRIRPGCSNAPTHASRRRTPSPHRPTPPRGARPQGRERQPACGGLTHPELG